jgi:ABC-type dipeptide/oligopeptide/nickel transport system permease subunit
MKALWCSITQRLRRDWAALGALVFLAVLVTVAVLAPLLAPYDPLQVDFDHVRQPPNAQHWLGTDKQGRDVLSRLLFGARLSLAVGFVSQAPILLVGVSAGCLAGYGGGRTDALLMRLVDLFYAFPTTLLLIALMTILGRGFGSLLFALTITSWAGAARLVRGQVMRLKQTEFVAAAVSLGAADRHILWRHILPNLTGILLVMLSTGIPGAVVAEAGLSFLGIGLLPPAPSWGLMLSDGFSVVRSSPHLAWAPALAIGLTMLALYTLGDSLRDALDPSTAN